MEKLVRQDDLPKMPTIQSLYQEANIVELKKQQDLNTILNMEPRKEWVVENSKIKVKAYRNGKEVDVNYRYIPIGIVEWLLTAIFTSVKLEIVSYGLIANSVTAHVRLHVKNPITNEWESNDGGGACPIQTNAGAGATDWSQIKSAGVQMGLPAAIAYAKKDAAENFGKIFGKDLNRKDTMVYGDMGNKTEDALKNELTNLMEFCQDPELKNSVLDQLIQAEDSKVADAEFYLRMINKMKGTAV